VVLTVIVVQTAIVPIPTPKSLLIKLQKLKNVNVPPAKVVALAAVDVNVIKKYFTINIKSYSSVL